MPAKKNTVSSKSRDFWKILNADFLSKVYWFCPCEGWYGKMRPVSILSTQYSRWASSPNRLHLLLKPPISNFPNVGFFFVWAKIWLKIWKFSNTSKIQIETPLEIFSKSTIWSPHRENQLGDLYFHFWDVQNFWFFFVRCGLGKNNPQMNSWRSAIPDVRLFSRNLWKTQLLLVQQC